MGEAEEISPSLGALVEFILVKNHRPELSPYSLLTARRIASKLREFQSSENEILEVAGEIFKKDQESRSQEKLFKISPPFSEMDGAKIRLITKNGPILADLIEHHRPNRNEFGYSVVFPSMIEFKHEPAL